MITHSYLTQLASVNRLLSHKHYFQFLTEVGSTNGTCTIENDTTHYVQRHSLIEGRELAIRAGLSKHIGEKFAALRICTEYGLIGIQTEEGKSYPFLHKDHLVKSFREQILLLGGGDVDLQSRFVPFRASLEASDEKLLGALKSVGSLSTLFALPINFTAPYTILATMYAMYEAKVDTQLNAYLQAFMGLIPPLVITKEAGKRKLYKRNNDEVDEVILLFKRLALHFSQL